MWNSCIFSSGWSGRRGCSCGRGGGGSAFCVGFVSVAFRGGKLLRGRCGAAFVAAAVGSRSWRGGRSGGAGLSDGSPPRLAARRKAKRQDLEGPPKFGGLANTRPFYGRSPPTGRQRTRGAHRSPRPRNGERWLASSQQVGRKKPAASCRLSEKRSASLPPSGAKDAESCGPDNSELCVHSGLRVPHAPPSAEYGSCVAT